MERFCCYLHSDGTHCPNLPEWEIHAEPAAPYTATDSCEEHLVEMLDDAPIQHLFRIARAAEPEAAERLIPMGTPA